MKKYQVKYFRTTPFVLCALSVFLLTIIVPFFVWDGLRVLNFITSTTGIMAVVAALLVPLIFLRKLFLTHAEVALDDSKIEVTKKNIQQPAVALADINYIKSSINQHMSVHQVFDKQMNVIFSFSDQKNTDGAELIEILKSKCKLVQVQAATKSALAPGATIFATPVAIQSGLLPAIEKKQSQKKRKGLLIGFGVFALLIFLLILPFFINKKAFYDERDGKVYFGSKELAGVKESEFTNMGYNVAKDCTHIFFRGEVVDFVDRKTFRSVGANMFYADKNGLYYESNEMYSKNKLKSLEGDYDRATFHQLGYSNYYKDNKNVFTISIFGKDPLKKIDIPNLDLASFEELNHMWYADKNSIYFASYDNIKRSTEIDRASFEVLTGRVAKDKNNVYYLTFELKSDDKKSSDKMDEYAILKNADAPTFIRMTDEEFRDKNTTWTIGKVGEKIEYREGKAGAED